MLEAGFQKEHQISLFTHDIDDGEAYAADFSFREQGSMRHC